MDPQGLMEVLGSALDQRRRSRGLTWSEAAREIGVSAATLSATARGGSLEGDGVLQMLRWLGRTPESLVPGGPEGAALPGVRPGQRVRFDLPRIHQALEARRAERGLPWSRVAAEIGGASAAQLTRLARPGRIAFPLALRIATWLGRPVADFTRVSDR